MDSVLLTTFVELMLFCACVDSIGFWCTPESCEYGTSKQNGEHQWILITVINAQLDKELLKAKKYYQKEKINLIVQNLWNQECSK